MDEILLQVAHLSHRFRLGRNAVIRAVDDVSFEIRRGEIFGLVGESGSGKSTAARCVMGLHRPMEGVIRYRGINTCDAAEVRRHRRELQKDRQIIFQDSTSSLNPRMTVEKIITEPMEIHHVTPARGTPRAEAAYQMQ